MHVHVHVCMYMYVLGGSKLRAEETMLSEAIVGSMRASGVMGSEWR